MATQFINYRGKEYPIKLGHYSMRRFAEEHEGATLQDAKENAVLYEHLIFYALKNGARAERHELDLTFEDMVDVLDDCMLSFLAAIPKFFPDDIPEEIKEEISKLTEEGGKETKKSSQSTGTGSKDKP
jgi:hypothetical protein